MLDPEYTDVIQTDSRMRAWWLTTFKGYKVKTLRRQPKAGLFGVLRYESHWLLSADPTQR